MVHTISISVSLTQGSCTCCSGPLTSHYSPPWRLRPNGTLSEGTSGLVWKTPCHLPPYSITCAVFIAPMTVCNHLSNLLSSSFQNHLTPNSETSGQYLSALWTTAYRGKCVSHCKLPYTEFHTSFVKHHHVWCIPIFSIPFKCQLWPSEPTSHLAIVKTQFENSTKAGSMPILFLKCPALVHDTDSINTE